jgi:dTDP-4-dehydrorhamnose 3,5-epimerase
MSKFNFIHTGIDGLLIVEPTVFGDERGYFMETYQREEFAAAGMPREFAQDNQSKSKRGVLRGLHYQKKNPQGKLVRVISGAVYDVGVDLRSGSPTFGGHRGALLTAENRRQFYVPEGFAHGFAVLSETAEFVYKCTQLYDPGDEGGIRWDDPELGIDWQLGGLEPLLSEKDRALPALSRFCRSEVAF